MSLATVKVRYNLVTEMVSSKESFESTETETLEHELSQLRPDLAIKIRAELKEGLSKASVYLVDCQLNNSKFTG